MLGPLYRACRRVVGHLAHPQHSALTWKRLEAQSALEGGVEEEVEPERHLHLRKTLFGGIKGQMAAQAATILRVQAADNFLWASTLGAVLHPAIMEEVQEEVLKELAEMAEQEVRLLSTAVMQLPTGVVEEEVEVPQQVEEQLEELAEQGRRDTH